MIEQTVWQDPEGELIQIDTEQSTHYCRNMSLEIAWHINDPKDLVYDLESLVKQVEQDLGEKKLAIHYNPLIRPLDRQELQKMLRMDGPLAAWRFALLAVHLCKCLKQFHAADIPQLIIHPQRIAILDGSFVLMPTLAGVLPPFPTMLSMGVGQWAHYIAPEVLRTRGNDPQLLYKGDIYALGKTLQVLAVPGSLHSSIDDPYAFIERLVERPSLVPISEWPAGFGALQALTNRMCTLFPEDRPALDDVLRELYLLLDQLDIESEVLRLISEKSLVVAKAHLEDLQASQEHGVFNFPQAKIHLLYAEIALAHSTPQFIRSIDQIKRAQRFEPRNASIYLKLARTYLQFTEHSQHLLLAAHAYRTAAQLSDWREDFMDEWLSVVWKLEPKNILSQTLNIPWDKRWKSVLAHRAASFQALGQHAKAWNECAHYFEQFGLDDDVFQTAKAAAANIEPRELIVWMHRRKGAKDINASLAIVWDRNTNFKRAKECYVRALLDKEQREEPGK